MSMGNIECNSNFAELGACIYSAFSVLQISNSVFKKNNAITHGGAIYEYGGPSTTSSSTVIINSIFLDNVAQKGDGGAIFQDVDTFLYLLLVGIARNTAINGAGIYTLGGLSAWTSVIAENHASKDGGGLNCKGYTLHLNDITFANNTASNLGGGFFSSALLGQMGDIEIINNTAKFGGGIALV